MSHRFLTGAAAIALAVGLAAAGPAYAQAPAAPADQTPAPPPHPTFDTPIGTMMYSAHIEGGIVGNPSGPSNDTNFGHLFTDAANSPRMNQLMVSIEKDIDPAATGLDWGFKFQPFYGTDARFTHSFGLWDRETHSPYQFDINEASVSAHVPVVWSGGIDLKGGIYPTPIGYELTDATGNFFYTHSYIFNFGIPLKHFGLLSTSHVNDLIDFWLGVDSGNQGGIPNRVGDNNDSWAGLFGFGLNNPIPNLTILALAHLGPENGYRKGFSSTYCDFAGIGTLANATNTSCRALGGRAQDPNNHARQIYDIVTTYKVNDNLTVANEINYIKDDLFRADGGGAALYGVYQFNDQLSFGARGEVFVDNQGFLVAAFRGSQDFVDTERGLFNQITNTYSVGRHNYSEVTLGVNYKPPLPALPLNAGLTIRPEVRWDHAWGAVPGGLKAFNNNNAGVPQDNDQFLISVDAIFGF